MRNIVLIGYMGSGKSTVGKMLSYTVRKPYLDTDRMIERNENAFISEIFERKGEDYFRELETKYIGKLLNDNGEYVIATGGGLPIREENRRILSQLGTVIYLKAEPDTIYERIKHDVKRPLLQKENPAGIIKEMLKKRAPVYESIAEYTIVTDGKELEEVVKEVGELYENLSN